MVEISIHSQFQALVRPREARFRDATGLETARITPTASANPRDHPAAGRARPPRACCSSALRDGDIIAITGGKGVSAVVEALAPERSFAVDGGAG